jgi:hypothetical protein
MKPFIALSARTEGTDVTRPLVLATRAIISLERVKISGPAKTKPRDATCITTSVGQRFTVAEDIDDIGRTIMEPGR